VERLLSLATARARARERTDRDEVVRPERLPRRLGGEQVGAHSAEAGDPTVTAEEAATSFRDAIVAGVHPLIARSLAGGGRPLPEDLRTTLERSLGADLSAVRIHDDEAADRAASHENAQAFTFGDNVVFAAGRFAPETSAGRWLLAHEVAHTVQQRGARPTIQHFDPDETSGGAEAEADAAADRATPHAARAEARFGPAATQLLRVALGLPRRGEIDAATMATLTWERVRDLPFFARPSEHNQVINWYGARDGFWADLDEARRGRAIPAVIAALEVSDADMHMATEGRARLVVTPHFVQRAVAWQVWQRVGMTLDGKLGNQALVMLGVGASGPARGVAVDAADGARAPAGTTFTQRLAAAIGAGRTTTIAGEAAPEVGLHTERMGGLSPAAFVAAMFAAHAALVSTTFFPGGGEGHSLEEALATLELAPGGTRRLSELTTTAGFGALLALLATPEAAALQHARFRDEVIDPTLALVGPLGSDASCGTVMLSALAGSATGVDLASNATAQAGFIRGYLGERAAALEPYFLALIRGEAPARPDPFPAPGAELERAIRAFLPFWATPYPGADVDPTTVRGSAAPTGTGVAAPEAAVGDTALPLATGRSATAGAAMIAHSTADARLAAGYEAIAGRVPSGFEHDWPSYAASFATIRFLNGTVTGHRIFLERLARAEAWLTARHADLSSRVTATHMSQLREFESASRLSYHHLGLAVDISAGTNPWIAGGRSGDDLRPALVATVSWYASWLTGHGEAMSAVGASELGAAGNTGEIWDRLHASSDATREYFALADDAEGLHTRITALAASPPGAPGGYANVPQNALDAANLTLASATTWTDLATRSRTADAAHWAAMIHAQQRAWQRTVRTTGGGFMNLERDLVIALRDIGGLSWGACDMGPHSASGGDFMHFDARTIFPYRTFTELKRALAGAETTP